MALSAPDEDVAWLANRVDELGHGVARMTVSEIRSLSRSLMDARQQGERSREVFASALAVSREAVRRATGRVPAPAVVGAVLTAVAGMVPVVPARTDRQAALAMALHWHSLAGNGVHLVSWDERSARGALKRFEPIGMVLDCDAGLVTRAMTGLARRSAYAAMVTFGSYVELATDYLRDNLHEPPEQVMQRGLHAAVVDDVSPGLVPLALSFVLIFAPRTLAEARDVRTIAAAFRRGSDYRPDRKRRAIVFTASAVSRLKAAVGWDEAPSLTAVTRAERVEQAIVRREGLGRSDERELLADVSVQGYLAAYEAVTGFSAHGERPASIDDILAAGGRGAPHSRELAFERLIDRQRLKIYGFRSGVWDEPDPFRLVRPVASDTVRVWLTRGAEALLAGLRDALAGWRTPQQIDAVLSGTSTEDELIGRATQLVEEVVRERADALGAPEMATVLRWVFVRVIDTQCREHLLRMRFLQRQSVALYDPAAEAAGAREADAAVLFAACEQAIRVESIKYALNVRP